MSAITAKPIRVKFQQSIADDAHARWCALTPQEQNVARCMTVGMKNDAIAERLGISMKTLDVHRGTVLRKLDCVTVGVAVIVLAAHGMIGAFEI